MRKPVTFTFRINRERQPIGEVLTVKIRGHAYEVDSGRLLRFLGTSGLTAYDVKAEFGLPFQVAYRACEMLRRRGKVNVSIGMGLRRCAKYYEAKEAV